MVIHGEGNEQPKEVPRALTDRAISVRRLSRNMELSGSGFGGLVRHPRPLEPHRYRRRTGIHPSAENLWGALPGPFAQTDTPSSTAPKTITVLTPELKARILQTMRLNRQAFQESAVLQRYGETRPPQNHPGVPGVRSTADEQREPAAQYPATKARMTKRTIRRPGSQIVSRRLGGLAGKRLDPLPQHVLLRMPGFLARHPRLLSFQLRLNSVSSKRSAIDDQGYMPDGTKVKLEKGWKFLGPDPDRVPNVGAAFSYCTTDGRPH